MRTGPGTHRQRWSPAALALAARPPPARAGDRRLTADFTAAPGFDPDCIAVDMAVSPEKITLLTDLAETFNGSGRQGRRPLRLRARDPQVLGRGGASCSRRVGPTRRSTGRSR